MGSKRLLAAVVAVVVLAGGAAGAWWWTHRDTTAPISDPAPHVTGDGTRVDPEGGTVQVGGGEMQIPAGAVADGSHITVLPVAAIGEHGGELFGQPVGVEHDQPLREPVTVRWNVPQLSARQRASAVLTRWDADLRMWKVSDARLAVDGDFLVATLQDFSFWDWAASASQWTGELLGKRVDAPVCSGKPLAAWVRGVVDPDEDLSAAALRVCFEPDRDEIVTARVANNRTFTQRLRLKPDHAAWAWTWAGREEFGPKAVIYRTAHDVFDSDSAFLLPPLTEVAVGIGRPDSPGSVMQTGTGTVDAVTVLVDVTAYIFDQLPAGGSDNPVINAMLQALYECGGKELLNRPKADPETIVRAVVDAVGSCATEIVDPASEFGARFEALEQHAIRAHPGTTAQLVARGDRLVHQLAQAYAVLKYADLLFYLSDQLADTLVGPLAFSVRGDGRPQQLGVWKPSCQDVDVDSGRIYRNLALQDTFADKNLELWQFDQWQPAARSAVKPLDACADEYLIKLADFLPGDWGDPKAARVVADEVRALSGYPAIPGAGGLRRLELCAAACAVTGTVYFEHPAYGRSVLITTMPTQVGASDAFITVIGADGKVRWRHRAGAWYRLAPADPAIDGTGHLFLNYDPGRYNGVIILRPSPQGFDTFDTLPPPGEYAQRFYSASLTDADRDGRYEVDSAINDCNPDCAGGTINHTIYRWNGSGYTAH